MKKVTALLCILACLVCCATGAANSEEAATLREFAAALEIHAARLDGSFTVLCDPSVVAQLKQSSPVGNDISYLDEILSAAGQSGVYRYSWLDNGIEFTDISWYAGWRILCCYQSGRTDLLSAREAQTLEAALALVSGASGSDLEKERYIFDALCARITYDREDNGSGEKDCAIGALLNGRADCDGYADAMVLCCGLAGIPCRYMHGSSRKTDLPSSEGNHLWNLVCIDGTWLICDVTWGDHEETSYLYFNIGLQDAEASYNWCPDTLFTDVALSADYNRHLMADQRPVTVYTQDDVYRACRSASAAGIRRLTLFCPDPELWQADWETFRRMLSHGAMENISYHDSGRLFEVTNHSLPDHFCFCDTESDMLAAIDSYGESGITSFTLYMAPSLSRSMLADDHAQLARLLSRSRLENGAPRYQYSENGGSVSLADVSYIEALPVCSTPDDVLSLIRRELPSRPNSLSFVLGSGLSFQDIREHAVNAIYALGVQSFSWQTAGDRVTATDLEFYDNYCLASSESDITAYLRKIAASGKSEARIYCSPELYAALRANHSSRFFELLEEADLSVSSFSYNDQSCMLLADNFQ